MNGKIKRIWIVCAALIMILLVGSACSPQDTTPEATVEADPTTEPAADPSPTAEAPTEEPTAEPTDEPTAEATAEPTEEPTDEPTAEPTDEPTAEPTDEPTAEATEEVMPVDQVEVTIRGSSFSPDEVRIPIGTTVLWRNTASGNHTVAADDGSFASGTLSSGDTFSFLFVTPGTYPYYCEIHGGEGGLGMSGVIIVE